ncbi:mammalian cell entry protein [Mycobacterium sp. MYCO198283]|uniref:mammalian cell entry protein n=1 Tax=Mycobacterium sp. MYCO198283 TaxID=2883505 RepID=UPI001E324697|nr:mammalian cell entry protein [Mycobacterium sp. MYCO198283]MCG5431966.1 mammalian cell entry protein [Mycobacterium sp. MYCO198283]
MSPRRRIDPVEEPADVATEAATAEPGATEAPTRRSALGWLRRRRWSVIAASAVVALLVAGAIAANALMAVATTRVHRAQIDEAAALDFVKSFMVEFTSPNPFAANQYADSVIAKSTGPFEDQMTQMKNQVVLIAGLGTVTSGSVASAGLVHHDDDGSIRTLVVMNIARASPDGKSAEQIQKRWQVTTVKRGQEWKISDVTDVP